MPFIERRVSWLELNDMSVLYEDGGLSADDIARRYKLGKSRTLNLLRRLGVQLRSRGGAARKLSRTDEYGHDATLSFRSKTSFAAFMAFQSWMRQCKIDATLGMAGIGGGFAIDFASMDAMERMLDLIVTDLDMDEDGVYGAITRRWKVTGNIVLVGERSVDRIDVRPTITLSAADFADLAGLVTP